MCELEDVIDNLGLAPSDCPTLLRSLNDRHNLILRMSGLMRTKFFRMEAKEAGKSSCGYFEKPDEGGRRGQRKSSSGTLPKTLLVPNARSQPILEAILQKLLEKM